MTTFEIIIMIWGILGVINIIMIGAYRNFLMSLICLIISPIIFIVLMALLWEIFDEWVYEQFNKPDWYETNGE